MKRAIAIVAFVLVIPLASVTVATWVPLPPEATALTFHSLLADQGPAPTLLPGATATYTVRFRNIGVSPWQRGGRTQVNLGVRGDSLKFAELGMNVGWLSANRVATTVEELVPPGGIGTFTFTVRAPATPGIYQIPLRPVADGITWLEDGATLSVTSDLGFHSAVVDQSSHPPRRPPPKRRPSSARPWPRSRLARRSNRRLSRSAVRRRSTRASRPRPRRAGSFWASRCSGRAEPSSRTRNGSRTSRSPLASSGP